jgi:hypothetical protein
MDEPRTASGHEMSQSPVENESGPLPPQRARPRQADIEVTLGRFLIFLAFPLVALAGALRLFDVDLGGFPPRLVTSNPPEASAEPAPEPEKPEGATADGAPAPDRPDQR